MFSPQFLIDVNAQATKAEPAIQMEPVTQVLFVTSQQTFVNSLIEHPIAWYEKRGQGMKEMQSYMGAEKCVYHI